MRRDRCESKGKGLDLTQMYCICTPFELLSRSLVLVDILDVDVDTVSVGQNVGMVHVWSVDSFN
jgi:hypothetical protein